MANHRTQTFSPTGAVLSTQQWSNATQAGDPTPAGYVLLDGNSNVVSTRALTTDESARLAAEDVINTANTNQATLQSRAQAALAANATFQALASPTQAQAVAQVQLLTREVTALIKLALGLLADTSGT